MTRGQNYKSRLLFVEGTIKDLLTHKEDFDYIKYAYSSNTDSEYVRIGDVQGRAVTLDVTARSFEDIIEDIARIVLLGKERIAMPSNVVSDPAKLRTINALFK